MMWGIGTLVTERAKLCKNSSESIKNQKLVICLYIEIEFGNENY